MKYYILYNDENRGPLELHELEEFGLNPASRVWSPGWSGWKDAGEVPEIQEYLAAKEAEVARQREQEEQARRQAQEQAEKAARSEQEARIAWMAAQAAANDSADTNTPPEPPVPAEIEWYIDVNDREVGPVKASELTSLGLTPDTLVWHDRLANWTPACQVPELSSILNSIPVRFDSADVSRAGLSGSNPQIPDSAELGNTYTASVVACIASVVAILAVFVKGEYYDAVEKFTLIGYCAAVPFLLSIGSLACAKKVATADSRSNAFKQLGLSIGLGAGAVLSAVVGILIAINDFYLA